jgi:hypothetical protein
MNEPSPPDETNQPDGSDDVLSDEQLAGYAQRLENLPLDEAVWVARLIQAYRRARQSAIDADGNQGASEGLPHESDIAQAVLDAADWLKTLWEVGYMGAGHLPAAPRSEFPAIELEDVLNSALLARIRHGRRPLPFPPPTRQGTPWHEVVESNDEFIVEASLILDESRPIGAMIEGCADWLICEGAADAGDHVVQHQGKGPRYRLHLDPLLSTLKRLPPAWSRRLILKERRGVRSFSLEWPKADGSSMLISLRAATWERAESEALHWVALKHPEMYGQIQFEHSEAAAA